MPGFTTSSLDQASRGLRGIGFAVALCLVGPTWALAQSQSLDSVDTATSHSLDEVEHATAGDPGGDRLAESQPLDQAPAASAEAIDSVPSTYGAPLGQVPMGESQAPNNDHLVWEPTPCSQLPTPQVMPVEGGPQAWTSALQATQSRIDAAKMRVEQATDAFAASLYRGEHLPATRVRLGEARDAARRQYSEVRCEMPVLLEAARRAGVEPGVLRPYQN